MNTNTSSKTYLIKHLNEKKPFRLFLEGSDFGIYKFNKENKRYEGFIGYCSIETMLQAITNTDYFIKLEAYDE